jgi:hypothetical protein
MPPSEADVIRYRSGVSSHPWGRSSCDPEARWVELAAGSAGRCAQPNDVRLEEGWPASSDPTADIIEPPAAGGKPVGDSADEPPAPAPPPDDESKIARLGDRRSRHGSD